MGRLPISVGAEVKIEIPHMKRISILGSTGSIGRQCLNVVESHPDRFEVVALAAGSNVELTAQQISRHRPKLFLSPPKNAARELCALIRSKHKIESIEILFGAEGIERVATHPDADTVVSAAVGVVGLPATYKAIQQGKNIASGQQGSACRRRRSGDGRGRAARRRACFPSIASTTPSTSACVAASPLRSSVWSLPPRAGLFAKRPLRSWLQ